VRKHGDHWVWRPRRETYALSVPPCILYIKARINVLVKAAHEGYARSHYAAAVRAERDGGAILWSSTIEIND